SRSGQAGTNRRQQPSGIAQRDPSGRCVAGLGLAVAPQARDIDPLSHPPAEVWALGATEAVAELLLDDTTCNHYGFRRPAPIVTSPRDRPTCCLDPPAHLTGRPNQGPSRRSGWAVCFEGACRA